MLKTTSIMVVKFAENVHHFATNEDYQCYSQHKKSIMPLLKDAPTGIITIRIKPHLFGQYYTYQATSITQTGILV